jgi:hypothetical protein
MKPVFALTAEVEAFNSKTDPGPLATVAIRPRRKSYRRSALHFSTPFQNNKWNSEQNTREEYQ